MCCLLLTSQSLSCRTCSPSHSFHSFQSACQTIPSVSERPSRYFSAQLRYRHSGIHLIRLCSTLYQIRLCVSLSACPLSSYRGPGVLKSPHRHKAGLFYLHHLTSKYGLPRTRKIEGLWFGVLPCLDLRIGWIRGALASLPTQSASRVQPDSFQKMTRSPAKLLFLPPGPWVKCHR